MDPVRSIVPLAASKGWNLCQSDGNNVFHHCDLDEKVYMKVPKGIPSQAIQQSRQT